MKMGPGKTVNQQTNSAYKIATHMLVVAALAFGTTGCMLVGSATGVTTTTGTGPGSSNPGNNAGPLTGKVHGGQQPIVGANIQIWAAGATGYGNTATSLMTTPVASLSDGSFTLTGDYTACTTGQVLYVTATGGDPGAGSSNKVIELMAVIGPCANLTTSSYLYIDEVTTAAAAFALSGFYGGFGGAPDGTDPIGGFGTASTNATGLLNAANTALLLANTGNGMSTAVEAAPPSNGTLTISPPTGADGSVTGTTVTATVETEKLYTIADIIATCVNSSGASSTQCTTLFADVPPYEASAVTPPAYGAAPTDTLQAAVYMALNPTSNTNSGSTNGPTNISALYNLTPALGSAPYVGYALSAAPNDWTMGIQYASSSALPANASFSLLNTVSWIANDASGNLWTVSENTTTKDNTITELNPTGQPLVAQPGSASALLTPTGLAIDTIGHVWVTDKDESAGGVVYEYQPGAANTNGYPALGTLVTHVTQETPAVVVSNQGAGYTSAPTVAFTGGNCTTQPTATVSESSGKVTAINLTTGAGYTAGTPSLTITGGGATTNATGTATVSAAGVVTGYTLSTGGAGYTSQPSITLSGGTTPATAVGEIKSGALTAIVLTSGVGCTAYPSLTFSGGSPTTTAVATVLGLYNGTVVNNASTNTNPYGPAIDGSNNVFFTNNGNTGYYARSAINTIGEFKASACGTSSCTYPTQPTLLTPTPLAGSTTAVQPYGLAVDPSGTLWTGGNVSGSTSLYELTSANAASPGNTNTGATTVITVPKGPLGVAIDHSGNVWTADNGSSSPTNISKVTVSNSPTVGVAGTVSNYTGGQVTSPTYLAIDGVGDVWVVDGGQAYVSEFNNSGTALSPGSGGFAHSGLNGSRAISIDGSGNVWIANSAAASPGGVEEIVGAAVPVVTPLSVGVKNSTLGAKP